eukprot:TRINITY_DN105301_c0_g1_i1.p1 TRINITY_DN105301_c0_g1~~TRINITY_DN105301_c0_g1_i1.p1  ORF type:complete len:436 (+),score=29.98 TRINITY_DN105301_c0_g1_i1:102-1409(+)
MQMVYTIQVLMKKKANNSLNGTSHRKPRHADIEFDIPLEAAGVIFRGEETKLLKFLTDQRAMQTSIWVYLLSYLIEPLGLLLNWYSLQQAFRRFIVHAVSIGCSLYCSSINTVDGYTWHYIVVFVLQTFSMAFCLLFPEICELNYLDHLSGYGALFRGVSVTFFLANDYAWGYPPEFFSKSALALMFDKGTLPLRHNCIPYELEVETYSSMMHLVSMKNDKKRLFVMKVVGAVQGIYKKDQYFCIFQKGVITSLSYLNLKGLVASTVQYKDWDLRYFCQDNDFLYGVGPKVRYIQRINIRTLEIKEIELHCIFGRIRDILIWHERYLLLLLSCGKICFICGVDLKDPTKKSGYWFMPNGGLEFYVYDCTDTNVLVKLDGKAYSLRVDTDGSHKIEEMNIAGTGPVKRRPVIQFGEITFFSPIIKGKKNAQISLTK